MISTLTTEARAQESITTPYQPGWSLAQWISAHLDSLYFHIDHGWDVGTSLTTKWTSAHGDQSLTTTRNAGEAPKDFAQRHLTAVAAAWATEPPV